MMKRELLRGVWIDMSKEGIGGQAACALLSEPTGDTEFDQLMRKYRHQRVPYLPDNTCFLAEADDAAQRFLSDMAPATIFQKLYKIAE